MNAMLKPGQTKDDLGFYEIAGAGVMAGFGLWGSMFPIDTLKSKIQSESFTKPQYKGMADALKQTLATEGQTGLWRGYGAALARAIPVNAAIFLAVEGTKMLLEGDLLAEVSGSKSPATA
jgi:solute carrier family 25 carnitine/acylcarnitine transporter 20/29